MPSNRSEAQPNFGVEFFGILLFVFHCYVFLSGCTNDDPTSPPHSLMRADLPSPESIRQLPKDGGPNFNRLIFESSPYLLQHARNPIDWYPWSEESLELARTENKPIFLSIGYTTCHWCHVMERESFEDQEVATLLNQDYICIKVDREERPDLDHVYMSVTQMMTGRGGWPMTVIMTPQKVPFFAGTYFPKASMIDLLPHFARVWHEEKDKVTEIGQAIISNLAKAKENQAGGDLNASYLDRCFESLSISYDPVYGGFGQSPKFPTPHALSFLLRYHHRTGKKEALEMVQHTIRAIRLSGTYDQIGFGIHRYSTDQEWLVPHFEKMLYDQALFATASLETFQITGDSFYKESCTDTLAYVEQKLSSPSGGFYSAEDADSEGVEGKFYLWGKDEILKILEDKDAELFCELYQLEDEGNYLDEATHQKTGQNIPHLEQRISEYADKKGIPLEELRHRLEKIRLHLFDIRETRIHPQRDDKVLTDWNGLMISAFARAGQALGNQSYIDRAKRAADFCLTQLRQPSGRLLKRWRLGQSGLPAHLDDYAFLAQGLLDLFEATQQPSYLDHARELIDLSMDLFEDKERGGFYLTARDGEELLTRPKEIYDGAIPSGNSIMALNLVRIWQMSQDRTYFECLSRSFSAFSGFFKANPSGAENFLQALAYTLQPPQEMVLCGNSKDPKFQEFSREINARFLPFKSLFHVTHSPENKELAKKYPHLESFSDIDKPTFFLCKDYSCEKPATELGEVRSRLSNLGGSERR